MANEKSHRKQKNNQREVRKEQQLRRLGTRTPECSQCGEKDPAALTGVASNIICYECQAKASKRSSIERHHPAGQHNDSFTVSIPGNDHRILSDLQKDWPQETLRNRTGSPALKSAAIVRGWRDVLHLLIERLLGWIPDFLEWLDERLTDFIGPQWWITLGWTGETK